jgi:adenosylcobinamide-phosphate synthase
MVVTTALLALLIEAIVGYPDRLISAIGHPVVWMGKLIDLLDRILNHETTSSGFRRMAGAIAVLCIVGAPAAMACGLQYALFFVPFGFVGSALLASSLIAQRSLYDHVHRVANALEQNGVAGGRLAVSLIVGRDVEALDESGIARAAIESLAENFSDGVVAPVFWLALGGLTGGVAYKAINTADSMIGHRTPRHEAFGFAAARLDDLANMPASRLSALLIIAAAALTNNASPSAAWRAVRRDAHRHRSPNAGYPEAAMAGALGLTLAGPRVYDGICVEDARMGDGRRHATTEDIRAALALYQRADAILVGCVALLAMLLIATG